MYRVVMTCNRKIWEEYGRRAAESFLDYWTGAQLWLYVEDFDPEQRFYAACIDGRMHIQDLPDWHTAWKVRHADNPDAHGRGESSRRGRASRYGYDFRRDCVRFSHKVAALTHAALDQRGPPHDRLVMLDADVMTNRPVSADWLDRLLPGSHYLAWLDRAGSYPECGFVVFNATHPRHRQVMNDLREAYESDRVFVLPETHDSFVLMRIVRAAGLPTHNLTPARADRGNPFAASVLAEKMVHFKGKRKGMIT
jgi:hypothetical protein